MLYIILCGKRKEEIGKERGIGTKKQQFIFHSFSLCDSVCICFNDDEYWPKITRIGIK